MDFIRKIINSDDIESIVSLPHDLKNKKVEILILPLEEKDLKKELEDMREEWERL